MAPPIECRGQRQPKGARTWIKGIPSPEETSYRTPCRRRDGGDAVRGLRAGGRVLPPPRKEAGKPLMQALQLRRSIREYSQRQLSAQVLSDLLWAAYGINRPSGDRTAPYWRHIMVIDVYAAMADGVWLYDPKQHALRPASRRRHPRADRHAGLRRDRAAQPRLRGPRRAHEGRFAGRPPAVRIGGRRVRRSERLSLLRVGGPRHGVPRSGRPRKLGRAMRLGEGQFVAFAQTVGYPRG